jgi:SAM-dependent methyltransferase
MPMNKTFLIERPASEQLKSITSIPGFGTETACLVEIDPNRQTLVSKIVFKTGGPADIFLEGILDFVCLAGIDKFRIELVEVFGKVKQVLRPGGRYCLLVASDIDSFIYYGMENGFDYLKSEIIETSGVMQFLVRNSLSSTSALFLCSPV